MTLDQLQPTESALVEGIDDETLSLKLYEMGCLPGEKIVMKFSAPLGDPIAIQVAGYMLSLRKEEARKIRIRPF